MLSINNLSYFIGGRPLYENANLHIKPKGQDRLGWTERKLASLRYLK